MGTPVVLIQLDPHVANLVAELSLGEADPPILFSADFQILLALPDRAHHHQHLSELLFHDVSP